MRVFAVQVPGPADWAAIEGLSDTHGGQKVLSDTHGLRTRRARAYVMDDPMYGPVVGRLFAFWDEQNGVLVDGEVG